jgi:hypothetical protein
MRLASRQQGLLAGYLDGFLPLIGDKRTEVVFRQTVQGIIGAESLVAARIAAYSPELATRGKNAGQRIRRMANGETTKRSDLGADEIIGRLQARGVEQLADQEAVWAIVDPSELRKPYARAMPDLMRVRKLGGEGTVAGYRTLNVLGVGRSGKRGILYHRLFTSQADEFLSESAEIRQALDSVGSALASLAGRVTYVMDTQFDDVAVWGAIWEQGNHLVVRLKHLERLVEYLAPSSQAAELAQQPDSGQERWALGPVEQARGQLQELARLRTEMLVRKVGQKRTKRQPTTAVVSACPLRLSYQVDARTRLDGPRRVRQVWLVEVRLEHVQAEPWLLLTDEAVADEQAALLVFRMYRERWAVEDCFKFTKQVLGWEDVQLMSLAGIRTLVALGWVAAGFLYELGVSLDWPELHLLARLGGWVERKDRPPGKTILTRGLQRLLDHLATEAILHAEIAEQGQLPPRLANLIGWGPKGRL